ncbi:MAG: hypothetical protein Q8M07_28425 [Prosthecobacter sp.]|nr:hypothetical protein [Prosthecobacter sp.]
MSPRRQRLRQQEQSSAKKKQPPFVGENPYRVHGFDKENCVPLKKDALRDRFSWKDKKLTDLPPAKYHIRLHLEKADVFALTLL